MNSVDLRKVLKQKITDKLLPIIGKECILLDIPYYHNIGDILIWEGEKAFLAENGIKVLYSASYDTCTYPNISKDTTILFNGGGNLGDIYHEHFDFLAALVRRYPNNRIVILPQTVYYKDSNIEKADFEVLLQHKDLYVCARDQVVYDHLVGVFKEHLFLVPDMAFCIPDSRLVPYKEHTTKSKLIIDRIDCEKGGDISSSVGAEVSDWPVFEKSFMASTFVNKVYSRLSKCKLPIVGGLVNSLWDRYAQNKFCNLMVEEGVKFISPYETVETTRLHGCILSILLDKKVILVDNSYGKNKNFYDTWLKGLDSASLV